MSSTTTDNTSPNPKDPSGFLHLDIAGRPAHSNGREAPTVVKIVGTARDDLNGLLGFCTAYNRDRERYMVAMANVDVANAPNATVMALKAANLTKASTIETYKAQFQQLRTDPRIRQRLSEYYNYAGTKCRPFKVEHVGGLLIVFLVLLMYFFGFTKTIMLVSAVVMIFCILVEDVFRNRKPWREVARNFPSRSKMVTEKQFPFLKGKLSEPIAAGIVGLLLAFTVQAVFFTGISSGKGTTGGQFSGSSSPQAASRLPSLQRAGSVLLPKHRERLEELYHLGFQDSVDGNDRGHSLATKIEELLESSSTLEEEDLQRAGSVLLPKDRERFEEIFGNDLGHSLAITIEELLQLSSTLEEFPEIPYSDSHLTRPPPPKTFSNRLLSMKTAGSIFYLYRTAMQVGIDPSSGIFSVAQLAANIQHSMPTWQKGMLAFTCYILFSSLFL